MKDKFSTLPPRLKELEESVKTKIREKIDSFLNSKPRDWLEERALIPNEHYLRDLSGKKLKEALVDMVEGLSNIEPNTNLPNQTEENRVKEALEELESFIEYHRLITSPELPLKEMRQSIIEELVSMSKKELEEKSIIQDWTEEDANRIKKQYIDHFIKIWFSTIVTNEFAKPLDREPLVVDKEIEKDIKLFFSKELDIMLTLYRGLSIGHNTRVVRKTVKELLSKQ